MEPRPAATVIVARPAGAGDGVEVLALRRSAGSRFAPGFVVFPGGTVAPGDADLAERWFGTREEESRACALRELAEEAGVVPTAGGPVAAPGRLPGEPGLDPPGPALVPEVARWIAPEFLPVRFDARFFALAAGRDLEPVPDGAEVDRAWWATPQALLDAARDGDAPLMWPTLKMLEALTACQSVDDVLALRVEQVEPPFVPPAPVAPADGEPILPTAFRP